VSGFLLILVGLTIVFLCMLGVATLEKRKTKDWQANKICTNKQIVLLVLCIIGLVIYSNGLALAQLELLM
jgi:hypothetical protein